MSVQTDLVGKRAKVGDSIGTISSVWLSAATLVCMVQFDDGRLEQHLASAVTILERAPNEKRGRGRPSDLKRSREIAALVAGGASLADVARKFAISPQGVSYHVERVAQHDGGPEGEPESA